MGKAVTTTASTLAASAILTPTESGHTAKVIAKYRSRCPIVAITPYQNVFNQLLLVWGVNPILLASPNHTDEMMERSIQAAVQKEMVQTGDLVVITAGVPVRESGTTNLMKVHVID